MPEFIFTCAELSSVGGVLQRTVAYIYCVMGLGEGPELSCDYNVQATTTRRLTSFQGHGSLLS